MSQDKLIFVYNADEGVFNAIMDSAHKLFAPSTYQCNLCAVTHGLASMRSDWKSYMGKLNYETRFYYREGFREEWPSLRGMELPAIFVQRGEGEMPRLLIRAEKLNEQKSVAQLTAIIGRALIENQNAQRAT